MPMDRNEILLAAQRIRPFIRWTPLDHSPWLSSLGDANVYVKLESEQITGSFKLRGAFNKLLCLKEQLADDPAAAGNGVVTASTGNHGMACAMAMKTLDIKGIIYVPENVSPGKHKALKMYNVAIELHGQDCVETEVQARCMAKEKNMPFISPYNDLAVAAGQGTIGVEIFKDLPSVDVVFVAVGGGGLIGGIATYLKAEKPSVQIIGCQPERSAVMSASVKAGQILDLPSGDTLSDGTAGGVEEGAITFGLCKTLVDEWILVTEDEIGKALYYFMEHQHKIIEGAAGVALAGYMKERKRFCGKTVVVVSCGANIGMDKIKSVLHKYGPEEQETEALSQESGKEMAPQK